MKKMDFSPAAIRYRNKKIHVDSTDNVTEEDVRRIGGIKKGREVNAITPHGNYKLEKGKRYTVPNNTKFTDNPGIRKASHEYTYGHYRREDWKNAVILDQIKDLEEKLFKTDIEVDNVDHPVLMRIPNFRLPKETRRLNPGVYEVPVIIALPDQFPALPPVGFFLPAEIRAGDHGNFSRGFHGAFASDSEGARLMEKMNYNWYCSSIIADTWEPAEIRKISDWRYGDNLWNVITLLTRVLSDFSDD